MFIHLDDFKLYRKERGLKCTQVRCKVWFSIQDVKIRCNYFQKKLAIQLSDLLPFHSTTEEYDHFFLEFMQVVGKTV